MVAIDKNIVNLIRYLIIINRIKNTNREYTDTCLFHSRYLYVYRENPMFWFNYRNINYPYIMCKNGIYNLKYSYIKVAELSKNY